MIIVFILGYLGIALEHVLKINKAGLALLTGTICWAILASTFPASEHHELEKVLGEHLGDISGILFFLLGAMTIVELIDAHHGFNTITRRIHTQNRIKLMWILGLVTFFLSAALDNLTTSIIMAALLRKIIPDRESLWMFGGLVIIAANAGGAWSPIGDVTTIMLWIGGQVHALPIMKAIFLPSLVNILVPLLVLSWMTHRANLKNPPVEAAPAPKEEEIAGEGPNHQQLIFFLGVGLLLAVPIFKTYTHLPPYMGILGAVGILWVVTELIHRRFDDAQLNPLTIVSALTRIDVPSVLFFLGILLAVAALQTAGYLTGMATWLDVNLGNIYLVNLAIGLISAFVDNVPLVAGAMGMYPLSTYPPNHLFWELLAYCAGTGGSVLIIGSAAGVAIMGQLHIEFFWYVKRISLLALIGYLAGIGVALLLG